MAKIISLTHSVCKLACDWQIKPRKYWYFSYLPSKAPGKIQCAMFKSLYKIPYSNFFLEFTTMPGLGRTSTKKHPVLCFLGVSLALLFRAGFKWRLQENKFFLVFGLIIHFMATTTKAKRCIFISRTPKCPGYRSILNKSRRYRLFSALLRSQFGPIWISSPGCLKQQWHLI